MLAALVRDLVATECAGIGCHPPGCSRGHARIDLAGGHAQSSFDSGCRLIVRRCRVALSDIAGRVPELPAAERDVPLGRAGQVGIPRLGPNILAGSVANTPASPSRQLPMRIVQATDRPPTACLAATGWSPMSSTFRSVRIRSDFTTTMPDHRTRPTFSFQSRIEAAMPDRYQTKTSQTAQDWTPERIRALGPVTDIATAGQILGLSRSTAYALAADDAFPTPVLRVGSGYRVPVAALLAALHIPLTPDAQTSPPAT